MPTKIITNGEYVLDQAGDQDGIEQTWALGACAVPVTLLAANMDGQPPAPAHISFVVSVAPGVGFNYYFDLTGIDFAGNALVERVTITGAVAVTGASLGYFWRLTDIVASKDAGAGNPGNTDVGWLAIDRFDVPPNTQQIDLAVCGIGVYASVDGVVPAVFPNTVLTSGGYEWTGGTIINDWILGQGQHLGIVPTGLAVPGNCVRIQCWRVI